MKVSAKAEYACLAMLDLTMRPADGVPARTRDIAESRGIPERYLVQILLRLKGAGLVRSVRGASGGYRLARPANRIAVADILEAIDGPAEPTGIPADSLCRVLCDLWNGVHEAQWSLLRETTLDQLVERTRAHEWII